ncbi:GGDEF domain-containing protein [Salinivibrio proteolyticus]|uniref:GGDEF domain-containing protein n=1 Tax=Salinivibrio proteolyticus TaxID=334715 RepID=UPI000988B7BC|nr:GGDEF domain-containing protein [Salinivibrio proteolyticus]OOF30902.1 hypothetical protein BZJ20_09050 [Salinivibrio proteolyticus]
MASTLSFSYLTLWVAIYGALTWVDMRYLAVLVDVHTSTLTNIASGLAVVLFYHYGRRIFFPFLIVSALSHSFAATARIDDLHVAVSLLFGALLTVIAFISARLWISRCQQCLDNVSVLFRFILIACFIPSVAMILLVSVPLYIDNQLIPERLKFLYIEFSMTYTTSLLIWVSLYTTWRRGGFQLEKINTKNTGMALSALMLTLAGFSYFPGAIFIILALLVYIASSGYWRTLLVSLVILITSILVMVPHSLGAFAIPDLDDGILALLIYVFTTVLVSISISIHASELRIAVVARDSWQRKASLDPLTGTVNRYGLLPELAIEHEFAKRACYFYTVAVIDIDHFKQINDNYGHLAGDQVLKDVASIITDTVRQNDLVARYGGEEFVVIFRNTRASDATHVAERIRERIAASISHIDDQSLTYTVSCGLAENHTDDVHPERVFDRADDCLYQAKKTGRNRVVVAPPP